MSDPGAMRFARTILALALALAAAALDADGPAIRFENISAPSSAAPVAGPSITTSADGTAWLTWLEQENRTTALKFSTYLPDARRWSTAGTIAQGDNLVINPADFPCLAAGRRGHATAAWYVHNPPGPSVAPATAHDHEGPGSHAMVSRTADGGRTWSQPAPLTAESHATEFVSLAALADGRVLAAWLDGRAQKNGAGRQQLFARVLGDAGRDLRVDASVCDCCQTALTAFPDGTALLAYRGRSDREIRDIRVTRWRGATWDEPRPLNNDEWQIAGCPVNGPQLASDGGRIAAAWFTAAGDDPRVVASFSPDAGKRFLMPLRLSEATPFGRVATALLHDGAFLVTFVDAAGALMLCRVTPDFVATPPVQLAAAETGRIKGFPRMALLRDYDGGSTAAELIVTFTQENVAGLRTVRVTVPEGDMLVAEKNCDCSPTPDQLKGFPIRGTIIGPLRAGGTLRVAHFEVPGIFAEGTRDFKVTADAVARAAQPGRQFLGRIEQRDGTWWLTEVRLIATAPR